MFKAQFIFFNFAHLIDYYPTYVGVYFGLSAVLSALFCYYREPIQNLRTFEIIEILLKLVALTLLFSGFANTYLSIAIIVMFIGADYLNRRGYMKIAFNFA